MYSIVGGAGGMLIIKDGANNLRLLMNDTEDMQGVKLEYPKI
jgi:hypothetical protein